MSTNPWLDRRVLHFAHQGGAREAPSSTLYAMRQALRRGADAIELDVHRTADGVLVVCHDSTVDRTTQASGHISALTLAGLRELDNAYWWVPGHEATTEALAEEYVLRGRFPNDPSLGVATLEEVLSEFRNVFLNFDIKDTAPDFEPYEQQLADTLRAFGRTTDVIVASFHDSALEAFRAYAPEIHTSMGPADVVAVAERLEQNRPFPNLHPSLVAIQVPIEIFDVRVVTPELIRAAHDAGIAVHVWTVDEPHEMDELLRLGVDAIITDCPAELDQALVRNNAPRASTAQTGAG
jgi:glycerophosphoryl diester phosphodiesterase